LSEASAFFEGFEALSWQLAQAWRICGLLGSAERGSLKCCAGT
jgi:hypothetical protein